MTDNLALRTEILMDEVDKCSGDCYHEWGCGDIRDATAALRAEIAALKAKLSRIKHGYGCDCGDHR